MKSIKNFDWLIIVFIHEIEFGTNEADKLQNEIEQFSPGTNKIVMIRDYRSKVQIGNRTATYFHLELFELSVRDNNKIYFSKLDPALTGVDPISKENWKQAFRYVFDLYSKYASRRMLLTWSHGAGFGINKEDNTPLKQLYLAYLYRFKDNWQPDGPVWQVRNQVVLAKGIPSWVTENQLAVAEWSEDEGPKHFDFKPDSLWDPDVVCKNLEIIWIWALAETLETVLHGQKIDILLMMNCNMQLFDTGYMLRKSVKYLVAPETQMEWYGYAYDKLFSRLSGEPQTPTKRILKKIRKEYIRKYENNNEPAQFLQNSTLFINRLKYYDKMLALLERSLNILMPLLTKDTIKQFKEIRYKRIHSVTELGYANSYDLIDMGFWLKMCAEYFTESAELKEILASYQTIISSIVFRKFIGDFYLIHDEGDQPKYGLTGISLFFPEHEPFTKLDNKWGDCAYYSAVNLPNPFTSQTTWDDFIKLFFKVVSESGDD